MKITLSLCAILILLFSKVEAQNLVLNPSFETQTSCPLGIGDLGKCVNWNDTNSGADSCSSPDYYAGCSWAIGGANSPNALLGYQQSHTGNHHAGIILYEGVSLAGCGVLFGDSYREYIEGTLSLSLVAGQQYSVSFWVSLANAAKWGTDDIAVYFSSTNVQYNYCNNNAPLPVTPQLNYSGSCLIDTANWVQLSWTYTAVGGETKFVIGNFKNDANTTRCNSNCNSIIAPYIYYFIDDVSVTPLSGTAPTSSFTISDNTICPGSCINFTDQSTNTPTSWSWTFAGGNPASSTSQNPGTVCFAASGSYTVSLLVSNATGSNSSSQTVTVNTTPTASAGTDASVCAGSSTSLNATGGTSYSWSPTLGLNNSTSATPVATPASTTTYSVTAMNAEGCTASDAVIVTVNSLPAVVVSPSLFSLCKGQGTQLTASGAASYTWSPSAGLSGTSGSSVFAIPSVSTTYSVTGVSALGCSATSTSTITVQDQPFVIASITNDSPCPGGGAIAITIIGGVAPYNFIWSTGATTQNLSNLVTGNYTLTVTSGPCTVVTTYTVTAGTYNPTLSVSNLYSCGARLNWTATPTASYYKVRYKIAGTTTWSPVVTLGNVLFYDFTGLASNTTYTFQVAAFCTSNQNLGWKAKNGKTQLCTTPINPTITNLTNTSATISWTTACSPLSFVFRYRKTGTTAWTNISTANTTVTIINLVNATQYEFQIRSTCGTGINSAFTALTTFMTAPRLEDTEVENTFHLFPNPNTGSFTLQIPSLKIESQLSIYNITGQLVYHSNLAATEIGSSLTVTLDKVADGLYEVVLNNDQQTLTQRLIIQK